MLQIPGASWPLPIVTGVTGGVAGGIYHPQIMDFLGGLFGNDAIFRLASLKQF